MAKRMGLLCVLLLIISCARAASMDDEAPHDPVLRFGAIADCQYADREPGGLRQYRSCPQKLEEAVETLNAEELSFVVHVGDFIDENWESFDTLTPITDRLKHPLRHVVGNHDYDVADKYKTKVHKRLGMPARYYSFEIGEWIFVVMDGNDLSYYGWPEGSAEHEASVEAHQKLYPDKAKWNGGMSDAQMAWLEEILKNADESGQRVALINHFPIFPDDRHNLWNAPDVLNLIDRHASPALWINGHHHRGGYGERNGVHYITLHAMVDTTANSFSVVEIFSNRIEINGYGKQPDYSLSLKKSD